MDFYNIDIYVDKQEFDGKPHFDLTVSGQENSIQNDGIKNARVKVTYSKFKTQSGYDGFQQLVYKAILQYDNMLADWMPTILYRCLEVYSQIRDIKVGQTHFVGGKQSLAIAKPLAQIFKSNILDRPSSDFTKEALKTTFTIKGEEFNINSNHFTQWVLGLIKQSILDDETPYSFGVDIINLRNALINNSFQDLSDLANSKPQSSLLAGRQVIASFSNAIHTTICDIQSKNAAIFNVKQLRLYWTLCDIFDLDGADEYQLDSKEPKKAIDSFRMLLKRISDI